MRIEVKRTHIRRGQQEKPDACPIALAVKESLGVKHVDVQPYELTIGKLKFSLPDEAHYFIEAFDENKSSVEPFAFEI